VSTLLLAGVEIPRSAFFVPPLTDAQFEALCFANDLVRFERTREGEMLMHSPAPGFTGQADSEIVGQLHTWWKTHRKGRAYGSSTGFLLSDGSVLSPDASYVLAEKLQGLTRDDLTGFLRLCPDFIVELLSVTDSVPRAQEKMRRWIENGTALGWLIDPYKRQVHVYEPGREPSVSGKVLNGRGPVPGFVLDLDEIWRCYEI
jgi:Uma2 family endonuclease